MLSLIANSSIADSVANRPGTAPGPRIEVGVEEQEDAHVISVRDNGARMVALSGRDAHGTFEQPEIVMIQWRAITRLLTQPGPFIYSATRTSLKPVSLD